MGAGSGDSSERGNGSAGKGPRWRMEYFREYGKEPVFSQWWFAAGALANPVSCGRHESVRGIPFQWFGREAGWPLRDLVGQDRKHLPLLRLLQRFEEPPQIARHSSLGAGHLR